MLQFAKQKKLQRCRDSIPPAVKLGEKEQVTEEIAMASLRRALDEFSSLQADDGHWPGDFSGVMFIMPGLVEYLNCICLWLNNLCLAISWFNFW